MAGNEVKLTIRIGDNGSLDIVTKKTKKATKETEKLANASEKVRKSRNRYSKGEKGVAQAGLSSAKSFSKMQSSMTGSGGLVPAYATLAANVFAATAAFGLLRRASQVDQLTQGLSEMGKASGLAMGTLAAGLQKATKNALTLEEAMRATSMITSAGLDPSMVDDFGAAAQKAAVALGRNTQDSLERFTRGVTKLEPELLDELGLFVRVDEASEDYARTLNKNASELTNFEKRQAFANATLAQAEQKFGSVNIPANPYDELAASFADLSKQGLNLLNVVLSPIIGLLAKSTPLLIGAMALFASTISGQVLGSLSSYAERARMVADANKGINQGTRVQLNLFNRKSGTLKDLAISLKDGSAATKEYSRAVQGQEMSQRRNLTALEKNSITQEEYTKRIKTAKKAITEIRSAEVRQRISSAALAESKAMAALQSGDYAVALKNLRRTMLFYRGALAGATKQQGLLAKSMGILSVATKATTAAFRLLGGALSVVLGPLSTIILLAGLAYEAFNMLKERFKTEEEKALDQALRNVNDTLKELKVNLKEVDRGFSGQSNKIFTLTDSYIAYGNATSQIIDTLSELKNTNAPKALEEQAKFLQENINNSTILKKVMLDTFGTSIVNELSDNLENAVEKTKNLLEAQRALGLQVNSIKEAASQAGKAIDDYMNSLRPKTSLTALSDALQNLKKSINSTTIDGPDKQEVIKNFLDLNRGLNDVVTNMKPPPSMVTAQRETLEAEKSRYIATAQELSVQLANATKFGNTMVQESTTKVLAGLSSEIRRVNNELASLGDEDVNSQERNLQLFTERVVAEEKRLVISENGIKAAKLALDTEKARGDISSKGVQKLIDAEENLRSLKIENLRGSQAFLETMIKLQKPEIIQQDLEAARKRVIQQINLLIEQQLDMLEKRLVKERGALAVSQYIAKSKRLILSIEERGLKIAQANIKAQETVLKIQKQQENRKNPFQNYDGTLTAKQEADIQKELLHSRVVAAHAEFDLSKKKLDIEFMLMEQRFAVVIAETELLAAKAKQSKDTSAENEFNNLATGLKKAKDTIGSLKKSSMDSLEQTFRANLDSILSDYIQSLDKAYKEALTQTQSGNVFTQNLGLETLSEGFQTGDVALSVLIEGMQNTLTPLVEQLKTLGPEGELVATVTSGAFAISQAWSIAGEQIAASVGTAGEGATSTAATLQAVGATLSSVSQIMQASANANIAEIDNQIAAEKRRDGKSAASINKIEALEKKKDKAKKKAFEQQKKAQMAMVVINTAASIAANIAAASNAAVMAGPAAPAVFAGVLGMLNAVTLGLGAAQLGIIAGSSYQGGGSGVSGGGAGAGTSISIGERRGSVDLATSQSARGEQAYFRGESGQGGPERFTPAFSGYKNRAEGGNTAYMVGEQGPELFVPERPGQIVPNDDIAASAPANVSFNINTIDASGVEDMLVAQRGNIIGMIRQAANSYGQDFVEDVDTSVFTQSAGGASRY